MFDTFWKFAHERQEVYFSRVHGNAPPWTTDSIIAAHRFTNVYRAADRVSQYLICNVIYDDRKASTAADTLFRVLVFKFFNRIDTWQLLVESLGDVRWEHYSFNDYDRVLSHALNTGTRIYSPAYIMPACSALATGRKHRGHLRLIEMMINDGLANRLAESDTMETAFQLLRGYPMLGDFLALQFLIDINYSELTDFSESDFVVPGPGARDGLRKVFNDPGDHSAADLIRWMTERQEQEFERHGLQFRSLWGRRLQLIDCQNVLCELDKYARVRHPEVLGLSGRTRIKQKYRLTSSRPKPWFPPKWGLNTTIQDSLMTQPPSPARDLFIRSP